MKYFIYLLITVAISACQSNANMQELSSPALNKVIWTKVDTIDVAGINKDLINGHPTIDVGIYFPSNFDSAFKKVTLKQMMKSFLAAKVIYQPTGVQLNLRWVKTGQVDPRYFSIQANEVPGIPETEYVNLYEHMRRHPAQLTAHATNAFASMIEQEKDSERTIYLIALQDVFYPFLEVSEGRNWTMKTVRTGGLSFPTYSYLNTIPSSFRGVITITNLERPDRLRSTIAHEIGHKVMNVSHEYMATNPGHEIFSEGGLMLYGNGEEIPSGEDGRWHLERLHLSPFLYRMNDQGIKTWNEDYKEGGHYYDPLYGDKVVRFGGKAPIAGDW